MDRNGYVVVGMQSLLLLNWARPQNRVVVRDEMPLESGCRYFLTMPSMDLTRVSGFLPHTESLLTAPALAAS